LEIADVDRRASAVVVHIALAVKAAKE